MNNQYLVLFRPVLIVIEEIWIDLVMSQLANADGNIAIAE